MGLITRLLPKIEIIKRIEALDKENCNKPIIMKPTNRGGQVQGGVRLARFFRFIFYSYLLVEQKSKFNFTIFAQGIILIASVQNSYLNSELYFYEQSIVWKFYAYHRFFFSQSYCTRNKTTNQANRTLLKR